MKGAQQQGRRKRALSDLPSINTSFSCYCVRRDLNFLAPVYMVMEEEAVKTSKDPYCVPSFFFNGMARLFFS